MKRVVKTILTGLLVAVLAASSAAFSLLGPFASWQTAQLGYGTFTSDIGGPMNVGEEYRLTVPLLTYGFDASFWNYFGSNGVAAVDAAFKILNDLPHVSQMTPTLSEFPLSSRLVNYQARSLNLIDLKSTVVGVMLAQMGLGNAERYVWTLRDRQIQTVGGVSITNYLVIKRNFDPGTLAQSSYVNGTLYTYTIREFVNPAFSDAVETAVDPLALSFTSASSIDDTGGGNFSSSQGFNIGLGSGEYLTGLTRDDAGGLRYLLQFNNFNIESLVPGVSNVLRTNGVFGPTIDVTSLSSPYGPTLSGTNILGGVTTNAATNLIVSGLRPGIGKVTFQRMDFDSLLYSSVSHPLTNVFLDAVITTNSVLTNQMVQRLVSFPDILFTAADLGTLPNSGASPFLYARSAIQGRWINFGSSNSIAGVGGGVAPPGPGVIPPGGGAGTAGIIVTFSTLAPSYNNFTPFFLNEGNKSTNFVWGYFDSSTVFSVFPSTTSLQELERLILRQ